MGKEHSLIIFWDSGDTIVEEITEKRDEKGIVYEAQLHEGCGELLKKLYEEGFTMALVADGEVDSFKNIYEQHQLSHVFSTRAISEALPDRKPAAVMFQTAFDGLKLTPQDKSRVVMIGNNLIRDVVGANRYGITSILFDWSTRYDMNPKTEEETPDYTVHTAQELYELLQKLDQEIEFIF